MSFFHYPVQWPNPLPQSMETISFFGIDNERKRPCFTIRCVDIKKIIWTLSKLTFTHVSKSQVNLHMCKFAHVCKFLSWERGFRHYYRYFLYHYLQRLISISHELVRFFLSPLGCPGSDCDLILVVYKICTPSNIKPYIRALAHTRS